MGYNVLSLDDGEGGRRRAAGSYREGQRATRSGCTLTPHLTSQTVPARCGVARLSTWPYFPPHPLRGGPADVSLLDDPYRYFKSPPLSK